MNRRTGYTLVEILVVATVGTAVFGVTIGVLYLLKEAQVTAQERFASGRAVSRLAEAFRDDVHGATTLERLSGQGSGEKGVAWYLDIPPDTTVEYRFSPAAVERTQSIGYATVRETYRLPAGTMASLKPAGGTGSIVTLRIEAAPPQGSVKWQPVVVEAVLGLDRRAGEREP